MKKCLYEEGISFELFVVIVWRVAGMVGVLMICLKISVLVRLNFTVLNYDVLWVVQIVFIFAKIKTTHNNLCIYLMHFLYTGTKFVKINSSKKGRRKFNPTERSKF